MKWSLGPKSGVVDCELFTQHCLHFRVSGSLFCVHNSGEVFLGIWNGTQIALKVLKTETGVPPRAEVCCIFHCSAEMFMPCL